MSSEFFESLEDWPSTTVGETLASPRRMEESAKRCRDSESFCLERRVMTAIHLSCEKESLMRSTMGIEYRADTSTRVVKRATTWKCLDKGPSGAQDVHDTALQGPGR
jgi:hypothetical protein